MRVFAYEHITGGGMLDRDGLEALAPEGKLMLRALVRDLQDIPDVDVVVMRDARLACDLAVAATAVRSVREFWPTFRRLVETADAVWPIAPEQGGMLERLSRDVLDANRRLLGCTPQAIGIATSKLATARALIAAGVRAIPTFASEAELPAEAQAIVVKPDDGAGCQDTFVFRDRAQWRAWLQATRPRNAVLQPLIDGDALSLSLICCDGQARLLACNRQRVSFEGERVSFSGVSVNAIADHDGRFAALAQAVVAAIPGLWGYVGIDLVDAREGAYVVEINPRLTTAYAGLRDALGLNVAKLVLDLPSSLQRPPLAPQSTTIEVAV